MGRRLRRPAGDMLPAADCGINPGANDQDRRFDRRIDLLGCQPGCRPRVEYLAGNDCPARNSSQVFRQAITALPDRNAGRVPGWRLRTAVWEVVEQPRRRLHRLLLGLWHQLSFQTGINSLPGVSTRADADSIQYAVSDSARDAAEVFTRSFRPSAGG